MVASGLYPLCDLAECRDKVLVKSVMWDVRVQVE